MLPYKQKSLSQREGVFSQIWKGVVGSNFSYFLSMRFFPEIYHLIALLAFPDAIIYLNGKIQ